MYEDQTYLTIMERILGRAPTDLDKAEGSLLWESAGPAGREFELVYMALDKLIRNAYPMTADREHLIRYADTYNMAPYPATKAVLKAEFVVKDNAPVENGSLFQTDDLFYRVVERLSDTEYRIECETPGAVGNRRYGQLLPAPNRLKGFQSARIIELLIPGEDEEDTEEFRARFKRSFNSKAYGWNKAQYVEYVTALPGVGDCKILRCPRGKGTVDVVIVDSLYGKPTDENVAAVQEALRPLDVTGPPEIDNCGLGAVAIGHDTIVYGARERPVEVGLRLTYAPGYDWEAVNTLVEEAVSGILADLRSQWGEKNFYTKNNRADPTETFLTVRLSAVERALLDIPGVTDYDRYATTINGAAANLELEWDEIPVLKEVRDG